MVCISLRSPSEAVKVFLKLGIRVYVLDDSYERIIEEIRISVSDDESSKLRKFSQIFSDLEPSSEEAGEFYGMNVNSLSSI